MSSNPLDDRKALLKNALVALDEMQAKLDAVERQKKEPIAIIGMSCRFPGGANSPDAYWELLRNGVDAIREFPSERANVKEFTGKDTVWYGGFLEDIDQFDPQFFGISPREATTMDPQQRLVLEVAWEALENAGQPPDQLSGSLTGVFIGVTTNDYAQLVKQSSGLDMDIYTATGTALNAVAGRLSYILGLQGPCAALDTACSSSLVAIHMACQSLRNRESDMVITGGVNATLALENFICFTGWGMMAPDGRCKTFDSRADGFVRGEGCGIIVLKRLSDALASGDRILAVIRGSAVNEDGHSSGLTVPNGVAQQAVIRRALASGDVKPADVSYVEAHGTGTTLGDPIEVEAIGAVFAEGRQNRPLMLGAVKSNIGHLESASGVAGLIKVVLSMQHGELPPNLHFHERSPRIPWPNFPVVIPAEPTPWHDEPRIAGVSSFGFSGVNAHVVLAEAPAREYATPETDRPIHLMTLSAKNESALRQLASRYADRFASSDVSLADAAYTANIGRAHLNHRLALTAESPAQAYERLAAFAVGEETQGIITGQSAGSRPRIAFLFTGQGSQYAGMGRELYETQPSFRAALDECDHLLRPYLQQPLLSVLYPLEGEESPIDHTSYTQPALFALEYALAKLWQSWGIEPSAVMGHSVGEYVAACIAGVFSLEDGLKLIATRGKLMGDLPDGGQMTAVFADETIVAEAIAPYADAISIAAVNGPGNIVISGDGETMRAVVDMLNQQGIKTRPLVVSHAFHSPLMNPILDAFESVARAVRFNRPRVKLLSNVTGQFADDEAQTPRYWRKHIREAVRFGDSIQTLYEKGYTAFVEIGPGSTLLGMGQRCVPEGADVLWLPSLRKGQSDWAQVLKSLSTLYVRGTEVDWAGFDHDYPRQKLALPTYPFQRKRYWVTPPKKSRQTDANEHPLLGRSTRSPLLKETVFENLIHPEWPPYLTDHRIYGAAVFPGAGYFEMALAATGSSGAVTLENVNVQDAMILSDDSERTIQLILPPNTPVSFQIISFEGVDDAAYKLHATGHIQQGGGVGDVSSLESAQSRNTEPIPVDEFYQQLDSVGLNYGATFRGLTALWRNVSDCEALGKVRLAGDATGYHLHPGLLDSCFHVIGAAVPDSDAETIYLPVGVKRLWFSGTSEMTEVWALARVHPDDRDVETMLAELAVYDDDGQIIAHLDGLRLRRANHAIFQRMLQPNFDDWLYTLAWETKPLATETPDVSGRWLVLADADGVGAALARQIETQGAACDILVPAQANDLQTVLGATAYRGVIHLWSLDKDADNPPIHRFGVQSSLHIAKLLAQAGMDTRLWLVTRGAVAAGTLPVSPEGSPLWGLGRVIALEQPANWGGLIDVDDEAPEALARLLLAQAAVSDGETQVAFREGTRLVARLANSRRLLPDDAYEVVSTTRGALDGLLLQPMAARDPAPSEVKVQVRAAGLNFRDVLNALGMYPGEAPLGNECAGTVLAVGEAVTGFAPGDDVIALSAGTFKSHVVTTADLVFHKPANLTFAQANTIPTTFLTAYYGLHTLAGIKPGDRVLIHAAAGGVGMAAVQLAQRAGAEIFATAGSPEKRSFLQSLGVQHVMNSRSLDFADEIMRITNGQGVNIVLNSLSDDFIPKSLSILADEGVFLEIGKRGVWSAEQVAALNPTLRYFVYDLAVEMAAQPELIQATMRHLLDLFETGELKPLPLHAFPAQQAAAAFRYMAQARHIGKVVLTFDSVTRIYPEATYLITGGLGGLGLKVAAWLTERGAQHLVLVGRRQPSDAAKAAIEHMQAAGARVEVASLDVASYTEMAALLETIGENMPPLRGIIHAAGVLDDALLPEQTWERFETAFAPKVMGAWNLQVLTQHLPLDFFVLFSAGAGLLGSPGQANYAAANSYLDALAQYRRALGLPAISIDWGAWAEVGMAARLEAGQQRRLAEQGMGLITPEQGVRVLEQILLRGDVQTAVLPIQWPKLLNSLGETVPPFLSNFARLGAAPGSNVGSPKGAASDLSKSAVVSIPGFSTAESLIADIWGQVLGVEQFNLHDNFLDIGGNSLMAVEIITKIEARTGIRLDSASIYVKTLAQLAASIESALPASEAVQPIAVETPVATLSTATTSQETPIYFGSADQPLYGMYHPPTVDMRDTAVVICPPWGQEFIRAHRACHQLAVRLSNAGFPVLRFDYYGTGDSGGNDGEHTISQSLRDIEAAIGEARARSGARRVALVGWRLGAALAALTASQRNDLASVVLWDPIVNGSDYLEELGNWHRKTMFYYLSDAQSMSSVEGTEFLGFEMSDKMLEELRQLDLLALNKALSLPVMLIERETQPETDALRARLEQLGASTVYNRVDAPQLWTENPDKALVPHQTLQAILSWMMEE